MSSTTKKLGLALSGGGFRAAMYHLGLVRFLRDAGILSQVTHITSVSGGSVFAAHLLLHWDRYNGTPQEFEAAANEVISFVQLDVRNRIARRFPFASAWSLPARLLGFWSRKLTRAGLLEEQYRKFLFGDVSLFELPERPQLHILSTNLSEGSLCSFHRNGLLMMKRQPGGVFRIETVRAGLATVATAVAASSVFPAFFPPLELTGADVGANEGEFGRQAYIDGGVFDNLAVRMFRCLERVILIEAPPTRDDFVDFPALVEALHRAAQTAHETPLGRVALGCSSLGASSGDRDEAVLSDLWDALCHDQLYREPEFVGVVPTEPEAQALLTACRSGKRTLDAGDQLWLNRHLLEAAVRQATGKGCFRRLGSGLDGVLVSDVGKRFKIQGSIRAGGLIRTAMRSSDILMDRVWQLESETFRDAEGFVFAPSTEIVEPSEDPTAMHPELQRHTVNIRTDLDRFSPLEISSLIRHGYCVARKTCRSQPELFGTDLPTNPPWDPIPAAEGAAPPEPAPVTTKGIATEPIAVTTNARKLQASAGRRIWSTLLDFRDWVSYVYVPIIVPILVLTPYLVYKSYERSQRMSRLVDSLAQGSRDLEIMSSLLDGPVEPFSGVTAEKAADLGETDFAGFQILQDSRIFDLRNWNPAAEQAKGEESFVYGYKRLKVVRRVDGGGDGIFHLRLLPKSSHSQFRFPPQVLRPTLRSAPVKDAGLREELLSWEVTADFQQVPAGEPADVIVEFLSPGLFLRDNGGSATLVFDVQFETAEVNRWLLLPKGKEYERFRIIRYPHDRPNEVEVVQVATRYLADDSTILAYKLLAVEAGETYEVTWYYK